MLYLIVCCESFYFYQEFIKVILPRSHFGYLKRSTFFEGAISTEIKSQYLVAGGCFPNNLRVATRRKLW